MVVEAVDVGELDRPTGRAEFVEHAATPDGLQLVRVTDEHHSPLVAFGEAR